MKLKVYIICGVICLTSVIALLYPSKTANEIMEEFYNNEGREEQLMDPLILNTDTISDHIIQEISNKQMVHRRYAIGFLGNQKIKASLQSLQAITLDKSEAEYIRSDALEAIYSIDKELALKLAKQHTNEEGLFGLTAKSISDGTYKSEYVRTYWEALTS